MSVFMSKLARRHDFVTAKHIQTCHVGDTEKLRCRMHVEGQLCTVAGASTPGEWKLVMNHTRLGSAVESRVRKAKKRAVTVYSRMS